MLKLLVVMTLSLTAADHWTTYLCLRAPVSGWIVTEANPIAEWLFTTLGLVPGLLVDSAVTVFAIGCLLATALIPLPTKRVFLAMVAAWTGYAVLSNFQALTALGLSPLGAA